MIYKEEAIDAIEVYRRNTEHILGENSEIVKAIKTCEMLVQEVEETERWIPVSEKLPEKEGRYLVTCSKIGAWEVDWNIWYNDPKPSWLWEQDVIAWMPLPEPFKEDEE